MWKTRLMNLLMDAMVFVVVVDAVYSNLIYEYLLSTTSTVRNSEAKWPLDL